MLSPQLRAGTDNQAREYSIALLFFPIPVHFYITWMYESGKESVWFILLTNIPN